MSSRGFTSTPPGSSISATGRWARRLGTVVGFLAGVFLVGVTLPRESDWLFAALPYLPFVFAPVVLVHAHLFLSAAVDLPHDGDRWLVRAGSHLLILVALAGVFGESIHALAGFSGVRLSFGDGAFFLWTFVPYPAALTSVGYALVWCGWGAISVRESGVVEGPPADRPHAEPT